jgi:uncharacterized cupredoxin-like copper-binding protein
MKRIVLFVAVAAALLLAACGTDDTSNGGGDGGPTTIDVTLQEWAVATSEASAPAGEVTFAITNSGEETHEFVVIRTDLDVLDLPTEEDGSVSEAGEGMEVVDEVEDIPAGESAELTVVLDAGRYALICNILEEEGETMEEGAGLSHFQNGMRTAFEVE